MPEKILIVEDEPTLQDTLAYNLQRAGYEVRLTGNGLEGLELAASFQPNLIVLDVMLPGLDGFEFCRRLRQHSTVPIIMLTARSDEVDRVVGLEVGADDYLTKPFSMRELLARVKAQLRRAEMFREELRKAQGDASPETVLRFGDLEIDESRHEARLGGEPLALKPQEYRLLNFFARHPRQMLSRERILEEVWGWNFIGDSRTVDVHVRWLRQRIEPDPSKPQRIITVRGEGYRFEG